MKYLFLSLLLLSPVINEETTETETNLASTDTTAGEQPGSDPEEPAPVQEITVQTDSTEAAQMVIDYLEERRLAEEEEKAAAEKAAEEERAKAAEEEEKAMEEAEAQAAELNEIKAVQANLDAVYTSNTNVIYGYANDYRYYLSYDVQYQDGYYTRSNKYIYCWPMYTKFEIDEEGKLKASQPGIKVSALYSGQVTTEDLTDPVIIRGLLNAYTNVDLVDYPSLYQINKEPLKAVEEIEHI